MAKVGRIELPEFEAVQRTLAFVNLGKVTNADLVYELFDTPKMPMIALLDGNDIRPYHFQRLRKSAAEAASILENDRAQCQVMIEEFSEGPRQARSKFGSQISELLGKGFLVGVPELSGVPEFSRGRIIYRYRFMSSGVEASSGYGVALLFDRTRPYGKVLRRCAYEACRTWFLAFSRGKGGPRPKYHEPACQLAADIKSARARVTRWRTRHK